jgi:predicted nucleic acid-binding protein
MVRKFKIEDDIVFRLMQDNIFSIASVATLSLQTYNIAFDVRGKYNISYWDSLVVASALEQECEILYSEDMQDGLILEDKLKIVNPF